MWSIVVFGESWQYKHFSIDYDISINTKGVADTWMMRQM
nr:MAG TPA: hypothetical protein [Caudoviricetes sp.]